MPGDIGPHRGGFEQRIGLPPLGALLLLVVSMLLGSGIGNGLGFLIAHLQGVSLTELLSTFGEHSSLGERNLMRAVNFIAHLFTFALPPLFVAALLYRSGWKRYFMLHRAPSFGFLAAGVLFLLAIFALSQVAYWVNQQLPLPDWASGLESKAGRLVKGLLVMKSPLELGFTLLVVAVMPAIGEELVFRGVLQQKLEQASGRPVAAIWAAALIFSAFHLQFAGLLPRLLLGAGLGYLYYWSRSLWAPITAHFFVNGLQAVALYFRAEELPEASLQDVNWTGILVAALLVAGLSYYLYQHRTEPGAERPSEEAGQKGAKTDET